MLKFKNISGAGVHAVKRADLGGQLVEAGESLEVAGQLVMSRPAPKDDEPERPPIPDDAYLVDNDGDERAWPKATWELVGDKPAAKAASVKEQ